jgi:NADPH-dependent 2,4-dienoyl-CoA reductase/sulfur reductase-like enzyme
MAGITRALVLAVTLSNFICDVSCLTKPHVTVVGAGFGGWGAVKALCENGCRVTLLDVLPDPTGATPYVTPTGKPLIQNGGEKSTLLLDIYQIVV